VRRCIVTITLLLGNIYSSRVPFADTVMIMTARLCTFWESIKLHVLRLTTSYPMTALCDLLAWLFYLRNGKTHSGSPRNSGAAVHQSLQESVGRLRQQACTAARHFWRSSTTRETSSVLRTVHIHVSNNKSRANSLIHTGNDNVTWW
jgi:hypothetical protein